MPCHPVRLMQVPVRGMRPRAAPAVGSDGWIARGPVATGYRFPRGITGAGDEGTAGGVEVGTCPSMPFGPSTYFAHSRSEDPGRILEMK